MSAVVVKLYLLTLTDRTSARLCKEQIFYWGDMHDVKLLSGEPNTSFSTVGAVTYYMSPIKRICVFEHPVMTSFNCACPAIQRGLGSGFLSDGSS